jgi:hypothetical protein
LYSRLEELIDRYRAQAKASDGSPKFVSFPNLGIRRDLLPSVPFDQVAGIYGNDMDIGCRIRLMGTPIHIAQDLVVKTRYPKTLGHVLRRKLVHAEGIAYVQRRLGPERWRKLEIGTHAEILARWTRISLQAPIRFWEKPVYLLMNLTYALGLIYYFMVRFRDVEQIRDEEIQALSFPETGS